MKHCFVFDAPCNSQEELNKVFEVIQSIEWAGCISAIPIPPGKPVEVWQDGKMLNKIETLSNTMIGR